MSTILQTEPTKKFKFKYRRHDWYDRKKGIPYFGIQILPESGKWMNLAENKKPLLYKAVEERETKLKELRLIERLK